MRPIPFRTPTVVAAVFTAALSCTFAGSAQADSHLQQKREQARAILAQVQTLGADVGAAAERWNGARYELAAVTGELASTKSNLKRARRGLAAARTVASRRLVDLYTADRPSTLEIVLGAAGLAEAMDALDTADRVTRQDSRIAGELKTTAGRVAAHTRRLARQKSQKVALVGRLASERAAIERRLEERRTLLAGVQGEVRRLEAAERARQVRLRMEAARELARQRQVAAAAARPRRLTTTPQAGSAPPRADATEAPSTPPAAPAATVPAAPAAPPAPPANASRGAQVVAIAMRYLGVPYKWGGASPSTGFDCSGLTMYVFAKIGVSLPHYAAAQYAMGVPVSRSQLQAGDLVFFRGLGHMGMSIGGDKFIHAPQTGDVVKISSLNEPYRVANWVGARRVL